MLAASIAPSAPPAPTRVCTSSITRMTSLDSLTSSRTFFKRSSNSPRNLVPAINRDRSRACTCFPCKFSGTFPSTISCAKPSAIAVLPTPGSPIKHGLFFVRRPRTWMTRSISFCRPTTGSRRPARARSVRFTANSAKMLSPFSFFGLATLLPAPAWAGSRPRISTAQPSLLSWSEIASSISVRTFSRSIDMFSNTLAATPSFSLSKARSKCSVPM
mmetsp:Transcript_69472/g.122629  ORF Transcript_69472/g.122629 Transcript_69472/m.122629 type:complete len:216 (-) Transcript_69472:1056-1703(-)